MEKNVNHAEDWDFYFSNVNSIIGSFFVDLGLIKIAPVTDKPKVLCVSIIMQNPREDGLSSKEESEQLYVIEDNIINDITNEHNSIYAGRLTSNGKRELYFYFDGSGDYEKTIINTMSKFPTYQFSHDIKEDKEWGTYLDFLYPLPNQYQMIMNARVIRNLEQNGDNLLKERMVDHFIYFDAENDMQNYIEEVKKQNFEVIDIHQNDDNIHVLHIGRIDKVNSESVNNYTLYLWETAKKYNGQYDGWGCPVEKE